MLTKDNIISVHSKISIDYRNCSIDIETINDMVLLQASTLSKKGYIVKKSMAVNQGTAYPCVVLLLNKRKKDIIRLVDNVKLSSKEHDENILELF